MKHEVGAQTIPWGETIKESMPDILHVLTGAGYAGVETGMRHFHADRPEYYRNLYADGGIKPLGLHGGGQFWLPEAADTERRKLFDAAEFAAAVGFEFLVSSGNKEETPESMAKAAETFAALGKRCGELGLRFAYHNHDWELKDNADILQVLIDGTEPETVSFVLDVAWAHVAGIEPENLMRRLGGRIAYLHIKDVKAGRFCELGTGEIDIPGILHAADDFGVRWLVVEQDYTDLGPEESMRVNRRYLRDQGI